MECSSLPDKYTVVTEKEIEEKLGSSACEEIYDRSCSVDAITLAFVTDENKRIWETTLLVSRITKLGEYATSKGFLGSGKLISSCMSVGPRFHAKGYTLTFVFLETTPTF